MANSTTIIRDLEFYWAKLDKPVSPFGTEQYDLQVRFPKKRVKEMSAYGKVKEQPDGQFSINITRKARMPKEKRHQSGLLTRLSVLLKVLLVMDLKVTLSYISMTGMFLVVLVLRLFL